MIKLLFVGDGGVYTGLARVTHSILDRLHASGEYDIDLLAINYTGLNPWKFPYRIHSPFISDEGVQLNGLGLPRFVELIKEKEYDVLVLFSDLWNIEEFIRAAEKEKTPLPPTVAYYPVDAPNIKDRYAFTLAKVDAIATYTKFGAEETERCMSSLVSRLRKAIPNFDEVKNFGYGNNFVEREALLGIRAENINIIPHGIDRSQFKKVEKKYARQHFQLPEDDFLVLSVATNTPRKRLDKTIESFKEFLNLSGAKDAKLVIHCYYENPDKFDLKQLGQYYGIDDKLILIHTKFNKLTDDDMLLLYNSGDVFFSASSAEGWHLPLWEAAACGLPLVYNDVPAIRENFPHYPLKIPGAGIFHFPVVNTVHLMPHARMLGQALTDLYCGNSAFEEGELDSYLEDPRYDWDNVAAKFDKLLKDVLT